MRISDLVAAPRWILLGEPGSGKSTTFDQAAAHEGSTVVTARRFVAGDRPAGDVVFIDAVEEFRIGEPGHDRLEQLTDQLARSGYVRWRLTCRSASLTSADLHHIESALGDCDRWNLGPLEYHEQAAILETLCDPDPAAFLRRVDDFAAAPLLGNPATLKLLYDTLSHSTTAIESRGALFAKATYDMAHEVNVSRPVRRDRSSPSAIIEAAEKACLVLMLSARELLWMGAAKPPRSDLVTKDELLPSGIDTQALHDAVDTPMFRGEADIYMPTHRMVAEYLAGRALAAAVSSRDGRPPALAFERGLALLCGDDGQPAPALLGTFAWFVTELAQGVHAHRALDLLKAHPEAILFQGDAAMLPAQHRKVLLDMTGQGDPWFLNASAGSTAIGGLAGVDLEAEFRTILSDPGESGHRRAMVLGALLAGRRVPGLDEDVRRFASDASEPPWVRHEAIAVIDRRATNRFGDLRAVVTALDTEPSRAAMEVKLPALARLVGHDVTPKEARKALVDYGATGEGIMGYASSFGEAISKPPLPGLFDAPLETERRVGESRSYEVSGIIRRVLARSIDQATRLTPGLLLRWLANAGFKRVSDPESDLRDAIQRWVDKAPTHGSRLFWELYRQARDHPWVGLYEYQRLTGRRPSAAVVDEVLDRLSGSPTGPAALGLARTAMNLISPFEPDDARYWRLWSLLEGRADTQPVFEAVTQSPTDHWQAKDSERRRKNAAKAAAAIAKDRNWLDANIDRVRDGSALNALRVAAEIYAGHHPDRTTGTGEERLLNWVGEDMTRALFEGWAAFMTAFPLTWRQQARQEGRNANYGTNYIAAAYVDHQLKRGETVSDLSLDGAFATLRGYYLLQSSDQREAVPKAAVDSIAARPDGEETLLKYWRLAVSSGVRSLPHAREFEAGKLGAEAVLKLLKSRPNLPAELLREALGVAARLSPTADLAKLVASTLKKSLKPEARSVWSFAAFLLDPAEYERAFETEVATWAKDVAQLPHGSLLTNFEHLTDTRLQRRSAFVRILGPRHSPKGGLFGDRDTLSEVVAASIKGLAETPTAAATAALEALLDDPALAAWDATLSHYASEQRLLRQRTEFRPPVPRKVADAIVSGPPATAADLRAVARECLHDLARDIRDGDTAGWKAFWNTPGDAEARTAREENDCRDLLLDRLRDRLMRFGMPADRAVPEARRRNDRRADLLLIGTETANLPVEAKRHMHRDLWTAAGSQLKDYGRSPGSGGQGVYLVFWFGLGKGAGNLPTLPAGVASVRTAGELKRALEAQLQPELRPLTDVIVVDVEPSPPRTAAARKKAGASTGRTSPVHKTGPKPRTRAGAPVGPA